MAAARQLYLASASPRRRELLRLWGFEFELVQAEVVEQRAAGESPHDYVLRVARDKARAGLAALTPEQAANAVVLAADTEVVLEDRVYGKPEDPADAAAMLASLSGRSHTVLTAVVVADHEGDSACMNVNTVSIRPLSGSEIERYVASGEPLGKAGAYAIQGRAALFIEHLDGCHSGVMGLPAFATGALLAAFGVFPA